MFVFTRMARKGTKRKSNRESGGVRKKGKTGQTEKNPTPPPVEVPVEVEDGTTISTSQSNDGSENEDISSTSKVWRCFVVNSESLLFSEMLCIEGI